MARVRALQASAISPNLNRTALPLAPMLHSIISP